MRTVRSSGPLLDRIDRHIEVSPVKFREITSERTGETSTQICERVGQPAGDSRSGSSVAQKSPVTPGGAAGN